MKEIQRACAKLYQRIRQHDNLIIAAPGSDDIDVHQTKADLTITDHTYMQPMSDALQQEQHTTSEKPGSPE
jgi:hypothetical protein